MWELYPMVDGPKTLMCCLAPSMDGLGLRDSAVGLILVGGTVDAGR